MSQVQLAQMSAVFAALCIPCALYVGWRLGWNAACDEQERLQATPEATEGEAVWP